ncbi:hypothetical protein LG943_24200 [Streptomonospora sp. S1-112]|uniref:Uncharacterized protein n=1 Tax=Streptomonospora mangrovi TaxID=2883123 RepID=A0A9X3NQP0_9ACTN|nr:hypothetical protein [Streptomonospora mangrovi]MDA0567400.1 hypothetical protein [Streptomonospora mangrovi]
MDDQGETAGGVVPARADPAAPRLGARALLPERFHYPMPGLGPDGRPLGRDDLPEAARRAAAARRAISTRTLEEIRWRGARMPAGSHPRFPLAVGAGASVAARDPDVLVVDARQWQIGNSGVPLPAADRIQRLAEIGMGDPRQFAEPRRPVPLGALHFWEDTLAAQGPLIDGMARFAADSRGRLLARIQPNDGSPQVVVEVEGTPIVATGVGQRVPGADRAVASVPDALGAIADHLAAHGADPQVIEALAWLPDREGTAQSALETLRSIGWEARLAAAEQRAEPPRPGEAPVGAALRTLRAARKWDHARAAAPGRALWSDEVVEGRFDAAVSDTWLVAGSGHGAGAAAETILAANRRARVVHLAGAARGVDGADERYRRLLRAHDRAWDGDGRLEVVHEAAPEDVAVARGPGGRVRFGAHGREAGAYVAAMGRVPRLPGVLLEFARAARVPEREITGELLFDRADQYLGYRVSVPVRGSRHTFEVAGSASRALPPRIFGARDRRAVERGSRHAAGADGGVVAGFVATAVQAVDRALHRHDRAPLDAGAPEPRQAARAPRAAAPGAPQRGAAPARRHPGPAAPGRPRTG